MSLWDFARLGGSEDLQEAAWALLLSNALLASVRDDTFALTPGAGLIWHQSRLHPVILADWTRGAQVSPGAVVQLGSAPAIAARVNQVLRASPIWLKNVLVFGMKPAEFQLAPGDGITSPNVGRVGCQVSWSTGSGFVTAGHVAPSVGSNVSDSTGSIGTVVWANDPASHGVTIEPDVAVIESAVALGSPIARSVVAGPASVVTVVSSGTSATIMGFNHFLYLPSQNATCGDTYFTTSAVTVAGDSGGPVMLGSDAIGHVVGASPGVSSFVQAVDYQLREAASRGGISGLGL